MEYYHSAGEATSPQRCSLTDIETLIREEFQELNESVKKSLLHAKRIGDLLIEAKCHIKFGHWEEWVDRNFHFTVRTARNYIAIAESWEWLSKTENFSDLILGEALKCIREQKAEEKGRENRKAKEKLLGAAPVTDLKELLSQTRHDLDYFKRISWKASAVSTWIPQVFVELEKTRKLMDEVESVIRKDFTDAGADPQTDSSAA
jgi:Protein of unknown function (DUF3102)